jgi:hypothetical protein
MNAIQRNVELTLAGQNGIALPFDRPVEDRPDLEV